MRTRITLLAVCAIALVTVTAAAENIVFVLDASNSMNKLLAVKPRIEAAQDGLTEVLAGMPAGENLGLMIYGHRINHENEVESCQDIELMYPLAPLTEAVQAGMIAAIGQVTAQGKTPLADSLVAAANELSETGGIIVLISDGEGNCGGDQDVVAAMIATMDPEIIVHVLGLAVDEDARATLEMIALDTGGIYWPIAEAGGLLEALYSAVSTRDIEQPVDRGGIPSQFACLGVTNIIYGTEGDDVIYGTAEGDLIFGLGGNDFLIGLDGNDVLLGGPGDDIIEGGAGNDILDGAEGFDLMFGGIGNDVLCGGPDNDSLEGDGGDDVLDGGPGCDTLLGGYGNDLLYSADGIDMMFEGRIIAGPYDKCPVCTSSCPPATECPVPTPRPLCPPPAACPVEVPAACPPPVSVEPICPTPQPLKTLNEGESIQLHGTVSDSDCNVVSYLWQVGAGSLDDPQSLDPVYTAPMLDGCENLDVEVVLTAVDSCGASASDAFILHILNVNHPPTVELGAPVCVDEGTAIVLPSNACDIDGEPLIFQWSAAGNLGVFDDPSAADGVYLAPMVDACDGLDILVSVTVIDPCGASACDTVVVHVRNVNHAPTADLGPDFALDEGALIRMAPVVNDPECDALTYCWTATAGSFDDPTAASPMFAAPLTAVCAGEPLVITLTVTDPCGLSASDSVTVHVRNLNAAPVLELGPELCMVECDSILLTPYVNDPDGDLLAYSWSATDGVFSDYCASAVVFTAPATDCEGTTVTITLTVTDPCGLSATDSITVRVENVNRPPTVHADP